MPNWLFATRSRISVSELTVFSDFGTIALCTRFKANRDSKGMAPAAWHIPESYPILDTEKRNNPWELVMEKVFVYRLPDDIHG